MGEFLRQVRSDDIIGPLRRKFTPKYWERTFSVMEAPDDADQALYDAGLVIYEKLHNIRDRLKLSTSPSLSATTKLRAFIAGSNHNFLAVRDKATDLIALAGAERAKRAPEGYRMDELAAVKLKLLGGFDWTINEVVESLVDGIEVPIQFALQGTPDLTGNPNMGSVEWGDISLEFNLGVMYRLTEDLWDDCLWNTYKLVGTGQVKGFFPQDVELKRGYSIGLARRQSLSMAFTFTSIRFHREMAARGMLPRIREVRAIERTGKRQVIKISRPQEHSKVQEGLTIMRGFASEPYYAELLGEPLPKLGGLTLSAVLDAWAVLSCTSQVLLDAVAKKHAAGVNQGSHVSAWLPEYAPVLQVSALVDALFAAAGIKPADGKLLIEFFTFKGQLGQEIWAQPLIPVGKSTVAPVFAAIVSPNLRRLVDVWMRQVGIDLSRRGAPFEAHVRSTVAKSIKTSNLLASHASSIEHDYTFKPTNGRPEQIDLIFTIGSTVFVAEAKCILEPTEAKGVAMHHKTVEHAAEQALRKAASIELNRTEFIADARRFGIDIGTNFKVLPLVVVSTSTHVGVPARGVPVIDELILGRFLDGELEDVVIHGANYAVESRAMTVFYIDALDAEAKAKAYFDSPPQLQRFINGVSTRMVPLHAIDALDWEGHILTLECLPTGDAQHDPSPTRDNLYSPDNLLNLLDRYVRRSS